jgi:LacI family transcriptional regulator
MSKISDVSRMAGVSPATVSRVFNKPELVDPSTRARVQEAIRELDYRPNQLARGLASNSSRTVGVVVNLFGSAFYGKMLDGIENALRDLGFHTIAESSRETAEGEYEALDSLLSRQCEAIVLHSDRLRDEELGELLGRHPQVVLMNRYVAPFSSRCVWVNHANGAAQAANHLLDAGHSAIAVVSGPADFHEVKARRRGFAEAMAARGIDPKAILVEYGDFLEDSGAAAMERILDNGRAITAIFFHNDEMAAGALDVCARRGIRVPQDISFVGFDDFGLAHHLTPKLTTVHLPLYEIGHAAGTLAHALATRAKPDSSATTHFEPELVVRASVTKPKPA